VLGEPAGRVVLGIEPGAALPLAAPLGGPASRLPLAHGTRLVAGRGYDRAMRTRLALLVVLAGAAASACGASARPGVSFCGGADLAGRFAVVPNSAGAGNIVYRLRLVNRSSRTCDVTGLPAVRLLDRAGKPLPTHPVPARPGTATAALVALAPGAAATADARFSPDVPGVGEGTTGPCERTAYRLRVNARGGGSTVVAVTPPTPVCEHGQLQLSLYRRA